MWWLLSYAPVFILWRLLLDSWLVHFEKLTFSTGIIRQCYDFYQNFGIKHRLYTACDLKLSAFISLFTFCDKSWDLSEVFCLINSVGRRREKRRRWDVLLTLGLSLCEEQKFNVMKCLDRSWIFLVFKCRVIFQGHLVDSELWAWKMFSVAWILFLGPEWVQCAI